MVSKFVMNPRNLGRRLAFIFTTMNLLLWAWFWVSFLLASRPYPQPPLAYGDALPPNVVFYREAWIEGSLSPRTTVEIASFPSWLIVHFAAESIANRWPNLIDKTFLGTKLGGSVLLGTMFLTFAQWKVCAVLIARLLSR